MIKIKVLAADNTDFIGEYTFCKNLIYVGSNHESDLFFAQSKLMFNHIFIEIVEDKLIIHIHPDAGHILVNRKRTNTFKTLKKNDLLQIEDITLVILDFLPTTFKTKKELLNECAKNVPNDKLELMPVIAQLSQNT